jgi:uroporphyrinogen decarboxylase
MSSKELIYKAINFKKPERLPVIFGSMGVSDIYCAAWNQVVPWDNWDNWQEKKYDEWGCGWTRTDPRNMGQVTEHPLLDWSYANNYCWPDPDDERFYQGMDKRFEGSNGKFVITVIFMLLFERIHSLRGFENALIDLYLERENIEKLADRIVDFNIAIIRNIASRFPGKINGLRFSDDWGSERALFIKPELWIEFFKPRYKKIFDACKEVGWVTWMHSCGKINDIISDLIDIGLDVINLQQPTVLGIREIGEKFAGKICFESLCDIQKTLPFKNREEIRQEAKLLLDCWGTQTGGFILGDYGDGDAIGIAGEKKKWMYNAFIEFDRWSKK